MGKHKKKHSRKDSIPDDLFDAAALSVRSYRKVTDEISKLSTGQKLVGGLVLAAAGYLYLRKLSTDDDAGSLLAGLELPWLPKPKAATLPPAKSASSLAFTPDATPRKSRKAPKPGKVPGTFGKKPAASPDDL